MSGSWQVKAMRDNIKNFDWTAGPNPYVTTRSSVLGYKFVSAFATGKNPDIAADFIKFFTGKASNSQYAQALMTISARTDTGTINYGDAKATSALNNLALELAVSPLAASSDFTNAAMGYVNPLLKENVIDVILGKKTAQQAAKDVNDAIESALKATAK
jgi:ABC-type glycerol-3-phosphate transport system substrate-binding protein